MSNSDNYGATDNYNEYADDYTDDYSDSDENYSDNYAEARGRKKAPMRPIAPAPARNAYQARPNQNPVTQAQLQAALAKVSQQINAGAAAVKAVDVRVRGAVVETERTGIALRKEIAERKKEVLAVRRDLQSTREMAAIMPMLSSMNSSMGPMMGLLLMGQDVSGAEGTTSSSNNMFSGPTGIIMAMMMTGGLGSGK